MDFEHGVILTTAVGVCALVGCALLTPDKVADASQKRQVICDFVAVWAPGEPKLKHINELCEAGADLKVIAGAYAGCNDP